MLNIWNLVETFKMLNVAYELLKNNDNEFKKILSAHKSHFITYIDYLNSLIDSIVDILSKKKYHLLEGVQSHNAVLDV
jgi:hypothetical protein